MRRLILGIVSLLITCGLSVGVDRLMRKPAPTAEVAPVVASVPQAPPAATPATTDTPEHLIVDYNPEEFNAYGLLYIIDGPAVGFTDFDSLQLQLNDPNEQYPGHISVNTRLVDGDFDEAIAKTGLITERHLYFTTAPSSVSGFEYRFEGEFLVKDLESMKGTNKPVLRGTLTKSRNGRTMAEQVVTFRVERLGC